MWIEIGVQLCYIFTMVQIIPKIENQNTRKLQILCVFSNVCHLRSNSKCIRLDDCFLGNGHNIALCKGKN